MKERISQCGAVGSSIMASICCIGPALATSLGIASFGALASFAAYRNYFIALAVTALGYSFLSIFKKKYRAAALNFENYRFGRDDLLLLVTTILVAIAIFFPQAQALRAAQSATNYEGRGTVVSLDQKGKKVTLKHEEIKDLMPAMTMEFPIKSDEALNGLWPGNRVRFTLSPQGTEFVVENIEKEER